jgi:hypothetical protein
MRMRPPRPMRFRKTAPLLDGPSVEEACTIDTGRFSAELDSWPGDEYSELADGGGLGR